MIRLATRALAAAGAVLLLVGCTPDQAPPDDAGAVITPLPSPTAAPSPSPDAEPTPTPTASAAPPALDEEAALAAARAHRADRDDCDEFADQAHAVVTTVDGRTLVFAACFLGAYQANGELLVWDGDTLAPVPVEQWQAGDVVTSSEVVGDVSGDGGTVVNQMRYRGVGDCGLVQRWSFDGTALVLEQAREQECTDDGEPLPPEEWPVVHER